MKMKKPKSYLISKELQRCNSQIRMMDGKTKGTRPKNYTDNSIKSYEYVKQLLFMAGSIAALSRLSKISTMALKNICNGEGKTNCTVATKVRLECLYEQYFKKEKD